MERIIDRFDKYMKYKKLSDNQVTIAVRLSIGLLGKSRKPGRDLSKVVVNNLLLFYTDLNRVWLLTGEGNMLNTEENNAENESIYFEIENKNIEISLLKAKIEILEDKLEMQRKYSSSLEKQIELLESGAGINRKEDRAM